MTRSSRPLPPSRHAPRRRPPLLCALLLGAAAACASSRAKLAPAAVPGAVDSAAAELDGGRPADALRTLGAVQAVHGIAPELRTRAEDLANRAVDQLITPTEPDGPPPTSAGTLEDLFDLDLSVRLRARLGVAAARRRLDDGDRIGAWKTVEKVEAALPSHPERAAAGDVCARAGLSLIHDNGRYGFLFLRHYRARGVGALEFLVLRYPFDPHCDEAYVALAKEYERRGDLDHAIERLEDLLLYHAGSPLAVAARAHLPRLRMQHVLRDDYDRSELERARDELEDWLGDHGQETAADVAALAKGARDDLAHCYLRLARNDLIVARFYRTCDVPFGTRQHAQRALEEAGHAGDAGSGAEKDARSMLAWAEHRTDATPRRDAGVGTGAEPAEHTLRSELEKGGTD